MNKLSYLVAIGVCVFPCFLFTGCSGPSSVEAVPRSSSKSPVFGSEDSLANESGDSKQKSNGLDLSFLHEDHFACLTIDIAQLTGNKDLADVPWDALQKQLAEIVGEANSNLDSIERAWVVIDRQAMDFTAANPISPIVMVFDFKTDVDQESLQEAKRKTEALLASKNDDSTKKKKSPPRNGIQLIGKRRVVYGNEKLIAKAGNQTGASELSKRLQQIELGSDVSGVLTMEPIRNTLRDFFEVASTFGGEKFKKLAALPEATQRVEFDLSIDSKDMLNLTVQMDDPDLAKEVSKITRDSMLVSNGGGAGSPMMPFGGFGGGLGGMGGGGMSRKMPKTMITSSSQEIIAEVGKEISDNNLFSVTAVESDLVFKLQRPTKTKELIQASLEDGQKQLELVNRVQRLRKIGEAMKAYHAKYDRLPPSGRVGENEDGVPPQLNWRVALLPFLDQQELYDRFDFSKPWDSPENRKAAEEIPEVFRFDQADSDCRFHLVGGEFGLHKDPSQAPKLSELADKKIWTAIVVESGKDDAVSWTQPGSLELNKSSQKKLGQTSENGVLILTASFDCKIVVKEEQKIRAVLSTNGNERLARADFLPIGF